MPGVDKIAEKDVLNGGREKLNHAIESFNQSVAVGDSSPEAAASRVDVDGLAHTNLRVRLLADFYKKADKIFVYNQLSSIVSGSPKETFSTLSALQAAHPDGTEGVFLVQSNGHWYYWASGWQDGGLYQSSGIASRSVGFNQLKANAVSLSTFDKSMNASQLMELLDVNNSMKGYGFSGLTDELIVVEDMSVTDYIPMSANSELLFMVDGQNAFQSISRWAYKIAVYDDDFNFIRTVVVAQLSSFSMENNGYIRLAYEHNRYTSIKNSITRKLKESLIEGSLYPQQTNELINFHNPRTSIFDQAFSQLTGNLVPSSNFEVTDYIPLPANHRIAVEVNGLHWSEDEIRAINGCKLAIFDKDLNWERTLLFSDLNDYNTIFNEEKFVRIQVRRFENQPGDGTGELSSIKIEGLFKVYTSDLAEDDVNENEVDLILFMGQSNMAGRGTASQAPAVPLGNAFEFRAISDPTKLYPLNEPFGVNENNPNGISENNKTGSLVSSFAIEYYNLTNRSLVGVSASRGGSEIEEWSPESSYLNDAIARYNLAKNWLTTNGYTIKNQIMLWCQGETDVSRGTTLAEYETRLKNTIEEMISEGIEKCYLVRIGNRLDSYENETKAMIEFQTNFCKTYSHATLVSTKFSEMTPDNLDMMHSGGIHFRQAGYNLAGKEAGINTAYHVLRQKEPTLYDGETDSLYYSMKI